MQTGDLVFFLPPQKNWQAILQLSEDLIKTLYLLLLQAKKLECEELQEIHSSMILLYFHSILKTISTVTAFFLHDPLKHFTVMLAPARELGSKLISGIFPFSLCNSSFPIPGLIFDILRPIASMETGCLTVLNISC